MNLVIRPFAAADYLAVAAVGNMAYSDAQGQPLLPLSAENLRANDTQRDPKCHFGRWVAELEGRVVAVAEHDQTAYRYHPHKFWLDLFVDPEHQRQGIGERLYNYVLAAMQSYDPLMARCAVREDIRHSIDFLQRRGWREAQRVWEAFLDLATFDASGYASIEPELERQGITIRTLLELRDDAERDRKLYDLVWELRQEFPEIDAPTRESFETFRANYLYDDAIVQAAYFVALDGDRYVGYSYHTRFSDGCLRIAQTGVRASYRRQGIALALKLHGIRYAQTQSYQQVRTVNAATNGGMLALNDRLGFRRRPAWIDFIKTFDGDTARVGLY